MNVIERCKTDAMCEGLTEMEHSLPHRRGREFIRAKVALLRLEMRHPKLSGFAQQIFTRAGSNPELKRFAYMLQLYAH